MAEKKCRSSFALPKVDIIILWNTVQPDSHDESIFHEAYAASVTESTRDDA